MRRRLGRAALALAAVAALAGAAFWAHAARSPGSAGDAAPASLPAARAAAGTGSRAGGAAAPADALPPLPHSLAGTSPDGGLRVGADGHFVPGPDALVLFDYFLSATGEEPDATIRARIVAEIRGRLPPGAAVEAEALLAQYLDYRVRAGELFASDLSGLDEERRFQRIRELRRDVFGAALAAALFGEEEEITAIDLERHLVLERGDLPIEERARLLDALDARLPESARAARSEVRAALDLRAAEARLRAEGASEAAIQAERERRVGPEAAARLVALDEERAAFQARVAAYRTERDALRAREPDPARYAEALARLRDERFQGGERLRIEALDRIAEEGRTSKVQ